MLIRQAEGNRLRAKEGSNVNAWEPKIIGFLCIWCSYAGADLAGQSRINYPANIRIIRVPCSGRMDPFFVLKSFLLGADGVLLSGCHPGECHYREGNYYARRRFEVLRRLIEFLGIDLRRLYTSWISAAEGEKFSAIIKKMVEEIKVLGPNEYFKGEEG